MNCINNDYCVWNIWLYVIYVCYVLQTLISFYVYQIHSIFFKYNFEIHIVPPI